MESPEKSFYTAIMDRYIRSLLDTDNIVKYLLTFHNFFDIIKGRIYQMYVDKLDKKNRTLI